MCMTSSGGMWVRSCVWLVVAVQYVSEGYVHHYGNEQYANISGNDFTSIITAQQQESGCHLINTDVCTHIVHMLSTVCTPLPVSTVLVMGTCWNPYFTMTTVQCTNSLSSTSHIHPYFIVLAVKTGYLCKHDRFLRRQENSWHHFKSSTREGSGLL